MQGDGNGKPSFKLMHFGHALNGFAFSNTVLAVEKES